MASDGLFDCLEVIPIAESALSIICYYTEIKKYGRFLRKKQMYSVAVQFATQRKKTKSLAEKKAKSKNKNKLFSSFFGERNDY